MTDSWILPPHEFFTTEAQSSSYNALPVNHCPLCPPPPSGNWNVWALKWENPPWSSRNPSGVSGSWQRSLLWSSLFMSSPGHRTHVSHSFPGPGKTQFTSYAHYTIINRTPDPVVEVQQKMLQHDCQGSLIFPLWYSETSSLFQCHSRQKTLHGRATALISLSTLQHFLGWNCSGQNLRGTAVELKDTADEVQSQNRSVILCDNQSKLTDVRDWLTFQSCPHFQCWEYTW